MDAEIVSVARFGAPEKWRPLPILKLDLDDVALIDDIVTGPDERVWVEAFRSGQVLGTVETRLENGVIKESVVAGLIEEFRDEERRPVGTIRDHLLPPASVVVPTIYREPSTLQRTVQAILDLDYPEFEIIVVDNRSGSGERSAIELPGGSRVRVVHQPIRGVSAARNLGLYESRNDIIAFTDDDVAVEPNWLRAMGERFVTDPEVEGISGLILPLSFSTEAQLWFEEFYGGFTKSYRFELLSLERTSGTDDLFPYSPGRFGAGANMAFRRTTLLRLGGFQLALGTGTPARGGEDLAVFMKHILEGGTLAFEPAALVRHSHRRTEKEFMSQVFGYGTGLSALFTSLVVHEPRLLGEIVRRLPAGVRLLFRPRAGRSPSLAPSYPRRTALFQLAGIAYGPLAYARSVVTTKWRR